MTQVMDNQAKTKSRMMFCLLSLAFLSIVGFYAAYVENQDILTIALILLIPVGFAIGMQLMNFLFERDLEDR